MLLAANDTGTSGQQVATFEEEEKEEDDKKTETSAASMEAVWYWLIPILLMIYMIGRLIYRMSRKSEAPSPSQQEKVLS
ncbi:MAG: hypothetical protein V7731_13860 [Amphritea sp.]